MRPRAERSADQQGRRAPRRCRARSGAARADRAHRRQPARAARPSRSPIGQWFPVKVHHAAAEVPGRVVVLRDEPIAPGETEYRAAGAGAAAGGRGRRPLRHPRHVLQPHGRRRHPDRPARAGAPAADAGAARRDRGAGAQRTRRSLSRACLAGRRDWIDLDAFCRDRALGADAAARLEADLRWSCCRPDGRVAMLPADVGALARAHRADARRLPCRAAGSARHRPGAAAQGREAGAAGTAVHGGAAQAGRGRRGRARPHLGAPARVTRCGSPTRRSASGR